MSDDTIVAYTIGPNNEYIDCSNCGKRSYNQNDVQQKYCGYCHRFLDDPQKKKRKKMEDREAMRLLGSRRSKRKAKTSRENGKLGGSPKLFLPCPSGKYHRWQNGRCRFCGHTKTALKIRR